MQTLSTIAAIVGCWFIAAVAAAALWVAVRSRDKRRQRQLARSGRWS